MILTDQEAFLLYTLAQNTHSLIGDMAEVGVYKSGSAKLIKMASDKPLHLFDTFEGLPELSEMDDPSQFTKGEFKVNIDDIKNYLKDFTEVYFYKGLFPETATPVIDKKFSFVHLDVDLYKSTLDCLEFFYPRMSAGGVIISHDYTWAPGVKKAFDEFCTDKVEFPITMYGTNQAFIIKCGL